MKANPGVGALGIMRKLPGDKPVVNVLIMPVVNTQRTPTISDLVYGS